MASLTVAQIAELLNAEYWGDGVRTITSANALEEAGPHELSFVSSKSALAGAAASSAGCLLVPHNFPHEGPWATIRVDHPRAAFARVLAVLYALPKQPATRHPSAVIDATASLASDVSVGPLVVIGAHARVGAGSVIGSGTVLGESVVIGEGCTLHANVTVYRDVQIGARVIIHSGSVIGADGFGFALVGDSYQKFPQVGTVWIGDDVELGANTCIDRAALGRTIIGDGSKLDNLVHVAHNVKIGRHVVVAAQTGFSGGVAVGDGAVIGGQVGVGDKAKIDSQAVVGSGSGILTGAHVAVGEPVWGTPARPLRSYLKGLAHINRLGEYRRDLKRLQSEMAILQNKNSENTKT